MYACRQRMFVERSFATPSQGYTFHLALRIYMILTVNSSRMATLTDENTTLRCKVEALEGIVQTRGMKCMLPRQLWGRGTDQRWYPPLSASDSFDEQPFHARARPTSLASSSTHCPPHLCHLVPQTLRLLQFCSNALRPTSLLKQTRASPGRARH